MSLQEEIQALEEKARQQTDFIKSLEIMDQVLELKRKNGLIDKPDDSNFECIGCGS